MPTASIRVFCRFRPLNKREIELGGEDLSGFLRLTDEQINLDGMEKTVTFDRVFGIDTDQSTIYNEVASSTVDDILAGYNGTVFAYGQTGAGKSWSMMGPDLQMRGMEGFDHSLGGIIPRSTEDIFEKIQQTEGSEFTVQVSYLEVYRETVKDLLDASKTNLSVREGKDHTFYVEGLTEEYVTDADEVLDALKRGDENRAVAATKMNAVSSRSHSVFMMKVNQRKIDDGSTKTGQLNLVDLAGSEKIQKTGASGQTLEEAKMINKSLSALSSVIKALADGKGHTPFRDSKLTLILRNSLGGNTKTSLLLAASPHPDNVQETISTLRFGERAKKIKTKVKANTQRSAAQLQQIVERLQDELEKTRAYVKLLEDKLGENGIALPSQPSKADVVDMDAKSGGSVAVGESDLELAVMVEQLKDAEEARLTLLREVETAQKDAREAEAEMQRAQDALIPTQIRLEDALKGKESVEQGMEELRRQLAAEKKSSREKIRAEEARSEHKKKQIAAAIKSLKERVEQEKKVERDQTMALIQQMKQKSEAQLVEARQQWQELSGLKAAEMQQAAVDLVAEQERKRSEAIVTEVTAERDRLSDQAEQAEQQAKVFEDRLSEVTEQLESEAQGRKDALENLRTEFQESTEEREHEHARALDALRAEKDAELAEKQAEMEEKLAKMKLRWHQSLDESQLRDSMSGRAKIVKPQQRTIIGRGSTAEPEPETEQSSELRPPEGECLKQRTVGTWPSRYVKIEHDGLTVFESKRKAEQNMQARGSSIRSLRNCKITAGYREFTFGGRWYKLTIFREDLEPPEQNYCFKRESDRDRFLTACQNIAEGRDWSVDGTYTRASARKAARAVMAARAFSAGGGKASSAAGGSPGGAEATEASKVAQMLEGATSDPRRGSLSCRGSIQRAHEDGGDASDSDWASERSFHALVDESSKYKLMAVFINDTERQLEYIGSWTGSGDWYQPPPQTISAGMTAAWGVLGTQGFTGESGPYGCVVYRGRGIEVIIAYQNSFGGQKIAGSVFTTGRLRLPDGGIDPAALEACTSDLLKMNSELNAEDSCHISWVPTPFASKKQGREAPRAQWILSDEPSVVLRQLRPLLERAGRSMIVCIENCTPYPLQLHDVQTNSGMWRTMAPSLIKAGAPLLPTLAVFATESIGAGTDAQITLKIDIPVSSANVQDQAPTSLAEPEPDPRSSDALANDNPEGLCDEKSPTAERGEGTATEGGAAQVNTASITTKAGSVRRTTVVLRWVNPKIGKRKWVEVKTSFQQSSARSAAADDTNVVIYWDEPEQRDTSRVTFRAMLEPNAEEIYYSSSSDPSVSEKYRKRFSPIPVLDLGGESPSSAEEGVPPDSEEVGSGNA